MGITITRAGDFVWMLFVCLFYGMADCGIGALPAYLR
jgi:hypothetical protein